MIDLESLIHFANNTYSISSSTLPNVGQTIFYGENITLTSNTEVKIGEFTPFLSGSILLWGQLVNAAPGATVTVNIYDDNELISSTDQSITQMQNLFYWNKTMSITPYKHYIIKIIYRPYYTETGITTRLCCSGNISFNNINTFFCVGR